MTVTNTQIAFCAGALTVIALQWLTLLFALSVVRFIGRGDHE